MRDHLYNRSLPSLPLPSHPNMLRLSHHTYRMARHAAMAAAASSDFLNLIHLECCRRKRYLIFLTHCDPQRTESQKQKLCDVITQSESQWCYICWRYVTHLCQPRFNTCPLSVFSFIFSSIYCILSLNCLSVSVCYKLSSFFFKDKNITLSSKDVSRCTLKELIFIFYKI